MIGAIRIGDGTAPRGWPAYSAVYERQTRTPEGRGGLVVIGVRCNFRSCGHIGSLGKPARMNCDGLTCECSCCRFLAGAKVHGCTYG